MSSPVLSPRAKAFTVQNLLRPDRQREQKPVPVPAQLVRELPYDAAPGWTDVSRKTDCRREPAVRLQPHAGRETWCTCHDVECMSLCRHPSVITTVDEHHVHGVSVELCQDELWQAFHCLGTEMIITRSGRRMFPAVRLHIRGLEPNSLYRLSLEFSQCGGNKYRYVYHSSKWMVAGVGEAGDSNPRDRTYCHPDSPFTGRALMSQAVSFERVKLTNSAHARPGQVTLSSMQKFQPKVHLQKIPEVEGSTPPERMTFVFPQTSFMAVTAYQNQQITRLKIARNPFAKGFRETNKNKNSVPLAPSPQLAITTAPSLPLLARYGFYTSPPDECPAPWKRLRQDVIPTSFPELASPGQTTPSPALRERRRCSSSEWFQNTSWEWRRAPPVLSRVPVLNIPPYLCPPPPPPLTAPLSLSFGIRSPPPTPSRHGQPVSVIRSYGDFFHEEEEEEFRQRGLTASSDSENEVTRAKRRSGCGFFGCPCSCCGYYDYDDPPLLLTSLASSLFGSPAGLDLTSCGHRGDGDELVVHLHQSPRRSESR